MRRAIVRLQPQEIKLKSGDLLKGPESPQKLGNTIGYYVTAQSRRLGHKNAIRVPHQGVSWTYIDLKKNACALANGFFEPDVLRGKKMEPCTSPTLRPGDRVLTCLGNNADFYATQLACAKAGAVMVPLNPYTVTKERIEAALKKYRPRAIIVKEHANVPSPALKKRFVSLVKDLSGKRDASEEEKLASVKRWVPEYNDATGRAVCSNLSDLLQIFWDPAEEGKEYEPPEWHPDGYAWPQVADREYGDPHESVIHAMGNNTNMHMAPNLAGSPWSNPDHPNNIKLSVRWNGRRTTNYMCVGAMITEEMEKLGFLNRSNWELFYQVLPELDQNISENTLLHIERHPDLLWMACTDHNPNLPGTVPLRNVMQWQQQDYYADRLRKVARVLHPDTAVTILPDSADGEVVYTHRNLMTAGYHVAKLLKMGNDTKVGVVPNCAHVPCGAIIAPFASLAAGSSLSVLGESLWNTFHIGQILNQIEVEQVEGIFVTPQHLSLLTPTVEGSARAPGNLKWLCVVGQLQLSKEQCETLRQAWKVENVVSLGGPPETANQLLQCSTSVDHGQGYFSGIAPNVQMKFAEKKIKYGYEAPHTFWLKGPGISQQRWSPSGVIPTDTDKDGFIVHDAGAQTWDDGGGNGSWLFENDDFVREGVLEYSKSMALDQIPGVSKAGMRQVWPDNRAATANAQHHHG